MRCLDCGTELQPMEGAVSMADFECPKCCPEWFEDERVRAKLSTIRIQIGDWLHGQTYDVFVECNKDAREVLSAHAKGSEECGFRLCDFCNAYDDNSIPAEEYGKLKEHGFERPPNRYGDEMDDEARGGVVRVDLACFMHIYLFLCKLGDPELEFEVVECQTLTIGGYGLFYM